VKLPEVVVRAVRRFPDNESGSKDRHAKWLRSCADIDSCVTTMPRDMMVWLATQIDRAALHGAHSEAWGAYQAARAATPLWAGWPEHLEQAAATYCELVEPYCRVLIRGWMRGVVDTAALLGDE
jgi:hypothetical protein